MQLLTPQNATDGIYGYNSRVSLGYGDPQWLEVDLGKVYNIGEAVVGLYANTLDYQLEYRASTEDEWTWNITSGFKCDQELFVRMAQCSALFPMMQFSWAPWRLLDGEHQYLCLEAARLHAKFADKIVSLANETPNTYEPIVRCMEYAFPHKGYEGINDQFMLGEDILVCPVIEKGAVTRKVILPDGKWVYADGTEYEGGREIEVSAPLSVLPYFEKSKRG